MKRLDSRGKPLIYLITKGETSDQNFTEKKRQILDLVKIAVETNVSLIQIREKQLSARLVFELVSETAQLTRNTTTKLLVNDRADIASAAGADGVHLTSRSLSADVIRQNFPAHFIVSVSSHSIKAVENARRQAADFAVFSPVFASPGKGAPQGVENLREICERVKPFPVIALGGVNATNYAEVLKAGASGFAAIRFLSNADNLIKLAENLRDY